MKYELLQSVDLIPRCHTHKLKTDIRWRKGTMTRKEDKEHNYTRIVFENVANNITHNIFKNISEKVGGDIRKYKGDKSGKSTVKSYTFYLHNGGGAHIGCYNFSQEMGGKKYLSIEMGSKEYAEFQNRIFYK